MNSKTSNFGAKVRCFYLNVLAFVDVKFFNLMNKINKNWKQMTIKKQISIIRNSIYVILIFLLVISIFLIPVEIITMLPLPENYKPIKPLLNYNTSIVVSIIVIVSLIFVMYMFHLIKIIHIEEPTLNEINGD